MIAPHRKGRKKKKTQDEDPRRTQAQALQEALEDRAAVFAWLSNFWLLVVRYERRAENYLGFVHLGCMVILMRYL